MVVLVPVRHENILAIGLLDEVGKFLQLLVMNNTYLPVGIVDRTILSCSYGGSVGALKAMGAVEAGMREEELQPLVDAWREANPHDSKSFDLFISILDILPCRQKTIMEPLYDRHWKDDKAVFMRFKRAT